MAKTEAREGKKKGPKIPLILYSTDITLDNSTDIPPGSFDPTDIPQIFLGARRIFHRYYIPQILPVLRCPTDIPQIFLGATPVLSLACFSFRDVVLPISDTPLLNILK